MDKLDHLGWVVSRSFEVEDVVFSIRTTSSVFGDWLSETLAAYRTRKKAQPLYSIVVADPSKRKDRAIKDFNVLYRGTVAHTRDLNLATVAQILLADIATLAFRQRDDVVYAGVAPIAGNGAVGLVPSAMVGQLADMGRQVARTGLTLPFVSAVALDPHTGAVLPSKGPAEIPADAVSRLHELGLDGQPSDRMAIPEPLRPQFVLTMAGPANEGVEPVSDARAVYTLASSVLNLDKMGITALETLDKVVSGADCYAVGGDARAVLRSVATLLTSDKA